MLKIEILLCVLQMKWCDLQPCVMGKCLVSDEGDGYKCECQPRWGGPRCDRKVRPCSTNPCMNGGNCTDVNDSFHCRCIAWWEGELYYMLMHCLVGR